MTWGKPYGQPFILPDGRAATMHRKWAKVRFFTPDGAQVGPEHRGVAPAYVSAVAAGWWPKGDSPALVAGMRREIAASRRDLGG